MKKILFLAVVVVMFSSCAAPYIVSAKTLDYDKISGQKDFFITESNSVNFDYKPIGSVLAISVAGMSIVDDEYKDTDFKTKRFKSANVEDAFKKMCEEAISKGADGIINVKTKYSQAYTLQYTYYPEDWVATGMMIKRNK